MPIKPDTPCNDVLFVLVNDAGTGFTTAVTGITIDNENLRLSFTNAPADQAVDDVTVTMASVSIAADDDFKLDDSEIVYAYLDEKVEWFSC